MDTGKRGSQTRPVSVLYKRGQCASSAYGIRAQRQQGKFIRQLSIHFSKPGQPIRGPEMWFGCNRIERGSGVIFPIEVLTKVYLETKDEKYLRSCIRAADFICQYYVKDIKYIGGLNDTTHKKSVKIDAVGVMFAMRSLLFTYEICREQKYLSAAEKAAKVLSTWIFLWDVPFNKGTVLGDHEFKTTGCDVIPAGSYVDTVINQIF